MQDSVDANREATEPKARWLLALGLFFFSFTYRSSGGAYWLGILLLCGWWIWVRPKAPPLPRFVYRCALIFCAIWFAHAVWIISRGEYPLVANLEAYRHYAELLLFIPLSVAMWHAGRHTVLLLWVPVIAVVVRIFHRTDYSDLAATFLTSKHYGFGTHHVTFGMQATLALLFAVGLAALTYRRIASGRARVVFVIALALALALLTQALVATGSRGAWICMFAGLATLFVLSRKRLFEQTPPRVLRAAVAIAVLGLAAIVYGSFDKIGHRFAGTSEVGVRWLSLEQMDRSVDIFPDRRIFLAAFGVELWLERPAVGHGPASVPVFLQNDPDFHIHPHLHNTYVQVLVEGGLAGALAMLILLAALAFGTFKHTSRNALDVVQMRWLLCALTVSWALWNLPNFHLHNSDWRFTWNWLAAIAALLMRMHVAGVTKLGQQAQNSGQQA